MSAPKKEVGRPTIFSQALADRICNEIADGKSLRTICDAEDMPNRGSVFRWLNEDKEFCNQYARAREEQAETLADELIALADDAGNPLMVDGIPLLQDGKPVMYTDAASVNHARLRVDTRKWVASKLKPKKYGDKIDIAANHSGEVITKAIIEFVTVAKSE